MSTRSCPDNYVVFTVGYKGNTHNIAILKNDFETVRQILKNALSEGIVSIIRGEIGEKTALKFCNNAKCQPLITELQLDKYLAKP